jgi:hypothetical protein
VTETVVPGRGYSEHRDHHAEAPVTLHIARYDGPGRLIEESVPPGAGAGWAFHRNLADHLLLSEPLPCHPRRVATWSPSSRRPTLAGTQKSPPRSGRIRSRDGRMANRAPGALGFTHLSAEHRDTNPAAPGPPAISTTSAPREVQSLRACQSAVRGPPNL